jgi:hypothetical protein
MCLARPPRSQPTIVDWANGVGEYKVKNIDPAGDPLVDRKDDDGLTRFAYHNVHTSTLGEGFEVAEEIDVIRDLGIDVQGFSEINKPWNAQNKAEYDLQMDIVFNNSRTEYSSMKCSDHKIKRQAGGNLLTVNGAAAGRVNDSGSDEWGRFGWYTMQGIRDAAPWERMSFKNSRKKGHRLIKTQ